MQALLALVTLLATSDCASASQPLSLNFVKVVTVTTDAEGGSARPEVIATQDRVFVVYLGNIGGGGNRTFALKVYDGNLNGVIASETLVSTTTEYGGPTDIRIAPEGQYAYAFYETNKPTPPSAATTYLWGAKYALNDTFDRVAYTTVPITTSKPLAELPEGGEMIDDPAPLVGPNSVFVVTRLKHSLSMAGSTVYRVREFSKDNLTQLSQFDLDLSGAADGRGRVTSLLFANNRIHMALATTVSDQGLNEANDDGAKSDIVLVRMMENWTFDPQADVWTLSAEPNDVENYVSGLETDGVNLYVAYKQSAGSPPSGEHRAWIRAFDADFNPVYQQQVKSTAWGPGGGEIRPSLEVAGGAVFSGQSSGQSLGSGNAEVYVYELDSDGDGTGNGADSDDDNDGYTDTVEAQVGTGSLDPCGTNGWPADLTDAGGFSANKVNISDLASFVGVPRYLNTNVGTTPGDARWDVVPGSTFGNHINIVDMQSVAFSTAPMLGGVRAFNGPPCPWPP